MAPVVTVGIVIAGCIPHRAAGVPSRITVHAGTTLYLLALVAREIGHARLQLNEAQNPEERLEMAWQLYYALDLQVHLIQILRQHDVGEHRISAAVDGLVDWEVWIPPVSAVA